ncbi:hypothetical protein [Helicobacter rodentium]|uniref:hypothetical protein n=1 Tax=Helicobacter rodentium TaxID=59617 RepID=UPI0025583C31|nr:hypothetical protein [Helicobacter rodentium]
MGFLTSLFFLSFNFFIYVIARTCPKQSIITNCFKDSIVSFNLFKIIDCHETLRVSRNDEKPKRLPLCHCKDLSETHTAQQFAHTCKSIIQNLVYYSTTSNF